MSRYSNHQLNPGSKPTESELTPGTMLFTECLKMVAALTDVIIESTQLENPNASRIASVKNLFTSRSGSKHNVIPGRSGIS